MSSDMSKRSRSRCRSVTSSSSCWFPHTILCCFHRRDEEMMLQRAAGDRVVVSDAQRPPIPHDIIAHRQLSFGFPSANADRSRALVIVQADLDKVERFSLTKRVRAGLPPPRPARKDVKDSPFEV